MTNTQKIKHITLIILSPVLGAFSALLMFWTVSWVALTPAWLTASMVSEGNITVLEGVGINVAIVAAGALSMMLWDFLAEDRKHEQYAVWSMGIPTTVVSIAFLYEQLLIGNLY